ncbi:carboxymuconolactone decarboxylase family protein [Streptomyces sp. 1222.5]|uniref:carboxymuconolactone decarboxylase family protein n=1 Tax=Streptomyces sp. 1222.5 TaxID=1881026 RepID=UPI003EB86545
MRAHVPYFASNTFKKGLAVNEMGTVLENRFSDRGEALLKLVAKASQDMANLTSQTINSWYYNRATLNGREAQIAHLAALVTLGAGKEALEMHCEGALREGMTAEEVMEVVIQIIPLAGFPRCISAAVALGDYLEEAQVQGEHNQ